MIIEEILEIIADKIGIERADLKPEDDIFEKGIDSFAFMEMVADLESKYSFKFTEHDLLSDKSKTAGGIEALLSDRRS